MARKKKLKRIFDKGSKARKRVKKALKDGKFSKKELLRIGKAGGTKRQLQNLRKMVRQSAGKIKISKKVDQKKEVRQVFKKAKKAKAKTTLRNIKSDNKVTAREIKQYAAAGASGKKIDKLTSNTKLKITDKAQKAAARQTAFIKVDKAKPKSERPNRSKNFNKQKAREKISTRFNKLAADYKGPERMNLGIKNVGKRPKSVRQYDKLGRNQFFKDMRARIAERYLGNMGKEGTKKNMKMTQRMLKSTSPKTPNFDKVKAPYSKTLDKLRTSLGGATDYKASLKMTKDKLTKTPSVNEDKLKKKGEQYLVT